ncbi:MAG: hypothetical protein LBO04_05050, partial [Spirochaetaceae bacterium]|nr:hypothetical protein [Spirochaetaceae bacterium]
MRKLPLTAALLAAFAVSLAAQEGTVLLDVGNYSKSFLNGNGSAMSSKYLRVAPKEDLISISTLEGDSTSV